jgi:hypothetical protein
MLMFPGFIPVGNFSRKKLPGHSHSSRNLRQHLTRRSCFSNAKIFGIHLVGTYFAYEKRRQDFSSTLQFSNKCYFHEQSTIIEKFFMNESTVRSTII